MSKEESPLQGAASFRRDQVRSRSPLAALTCHERNAAEPFSSGPRGSIASVGNMPVFAGEAMIRVLNEQREHRGLDWTALADELWEQSRELNTELSDHSLCPGALVRTAKRGSMSCQYAAIILRWIRRAPEEFLTGPVVDVGDGRLPEAGPNTRLRWDLPELHAALNAYRIERQLTWTALGGELDCTPNRLTNLRTARLADMGLTMRVTQRIGRPAAAFIHPARW
jgi:hypothetical protein